MAKNNRDKTKENKIISKQKKFGKRILLSVAGILLLCLISFGAYSAAFAHKNYLNQRVGSLNLGGKTKDETRAILENNADQFLKQSLSLNFAQTDGKYKNYSIDPKDINLQFNTDTTLDQIWQNGRDKNTLSSLWQQLKGIFVVKKYQLVYALDSDILNKKIEAIAKETDQPEKDYAIEFSGGKFILNTDAKDGSRIDQTKILNQIKSQIGETNSSQINFSAQSYKPAVTKENAEKCLVKANQIVALGDLSLIYKNQQQKLDINTIGGIVQSQPSGNDLKLIFNEDVLSAFVGSVAQGINVVPKNATLGVTNGVVTVATPETLGQALNEDQTKEDITSTLLARISNPTSSVDQASINLKVDTKEPEITSASIATLGLKDLIGSGTTNFGNSPSNRIHNITLGASTINGALLKPGETFSTLGHLGSIDAASGYLQELVIKNNKTVPDFGGGLCQVSTTLFRAALNSGMNITERQNHAYRVIYYEPPVGMDATIYDPSPDFKFKNNYDSYVLIQSHINGKNITFDFYGTKDTRTVSISDPVITNVTDPDPPLMIPTDTLPVGTTKKTDSAHQGCTAKVDYSVMRDGQTLQQKTFTSFYVPWQEKWLVGTSGATPAEPAPTANVDSSTPTTPAPAT